MNVIFEESRRVRYGATCKILGAAQLLTLTLHHSRHTFISHALAGNKTLVEARDAAGHANVTVTSEYLHVAVDDNAVGRLFAQVAVL